MAHYRTVLIQQAQAEPITISEAIAHLRESDTALVSIYVKAATQSIEQELISVNLMQSVYELQMDDWYLDGDDCIMLPRNPLVEIVSVKYDDIANVEQTIPTNQYQIDTASVPGRIRFVGVTLPEVYDKINAVRVRYKAGYGVVGANVEQQQYAVPAPLKAAVQLRLGQLYENRQEEITGSITSSFSIGVERLIAPYRIPL